METSGVQRTMTNRSVITYYQQTVCYLSLVSVVTLSGSLGIAQMGMAQTNMAQTNMAQTTKPNPQFQQIQQIAQAQAQVTGTVRYLQRIALPPNAVVEVTLQEVSRLDAAAVLLAEQKIPTTGQQVPIPFTLTYDASQIEPRYTYVVRAKITVDGQMRWTSTTAYRVITQNNPTTVDILVELVRGSSASTSVNPPVNSPVNPPTQTTRFDCRSQARSHPAAQNVSLSEAQRLRLQRDGNQFLYQCVPTTAKAEEVLYRCQTQATGYTDRDGLTITEAETLQQQTDGSRFVYQCSPAR